MDLKIKDVAELLNVSETTIRRWLSDGKIPAYRLNHQFRFSRIEIENWVMSCKMGEERNDGVPFDGALESLKDSAENIPVSSGTQQFSMFRALHKGEVYHNVSGQTKEQIIREAMQQAAENFNFDSDVLTDLLLDRERLMPTALNHGIAVPHTRDFLFKEPYDVVLVVYPQKPIDYGALDGRPVHTLFFLFACEDKRHLHLLAKLAHLSSHEESRKFLQTKPAKDALLSYIKNWEGTLKAPALV